MDSDPRRTKFCSSLCLRKSSVKRKHLYNTGEPFTPLPITPELKLKYGCPGNPQPERLIHDLEVVGGVRKVNCRSYGRCLNLASAARWEGFNCKSCDQYVELSEDAKRSDMLGLALLIEEMMNEDPDDETVDADELML